MRKVANRQTIRFFVNDFWVLQEIRRRAKIKGISISAELIENSRQKYMMEKAGNVGKIVEINQYLYNIVELLTKEFSKFIDERENRKEGILDGREQFS